MTTIRNNLVGLGIDTKSNYQNPSLGKINEMYYDEINRRIKYNSSKKYDSCLEIFNLCKEAAIMKNQLGATRVNIKLLVENSTKDYDYLVEAKIPLNNNHIGENLLFLGWNDPTRYSDLETTLREDEIIRSLKNHQHANNFISDNYFIDKLTYYNRSIDDINDLCVLYNDAFKTYTSKLDFDSIGDMINNSVVYVVRDLDDRKINNSGRIVSSCVGEIARLNDNFTICELSEMATLYDYRGQHLVTKATELLVDEICDEVDLIFAEARACHRAINQSFYNMGFKYAGRLNKQCILSGRGEDSTVLEEGPYENLNVWYILPK
jgi:hypothetical protein